MKKKTTYSKAQKETIKNAIKVSINSGYEQYVYEEENGDFTFGRLYNGCIIGCHNVKRIVGVVINGTFYDYEQSKTICDNKLKNTIISWQ